MTIQDIITYLESVAPLSLQESYDNSGLLVGESNMEVSSVLLSLDVTTEVVDEAINRKCNCIIAHHPVIFSGLRKLTGSNYTERIVMQAVRNNIAIYAIHTNLDNIKSGVNHAFAEKIGLQELQVLRPASEHLRKLVTFAPLQHAVAIRQAMFNAGAGNIGNYNECSFNMEGTGTFRGNADSNPALGQQGVMHTEPEMRIELIFPVWKEKAILKALREAHLYEEVAYDVYPLTNAYQETGAGMLGMLKDPIPETAFLQLLKTQMQTDTIRHTALLGKSVQKVAICGGAGSFLLADAMRAGADAFVSADFKYHQFFDADGKILVADIGHYESEQFTVHLLYRLLQKKFPNFALHFSSINTNPVKYF